MIDVELELEPAGTLELALTYPAGAAASLVVAQAWRGTQTAAAIDVVAPLAHTARFSRTADGVPNVRLRWVPAGTLSFAVEAPDHVPVVRTLEFPQGGTRESVELHPAHEGRGVVRGSVVCEGEEPPAFALQVYMDTVDRARPSPVIRTLSFERVDGSWLADFAFEGLDERERFLIVREDVGFGFPRIPVTTTPAQHQVVPDGEPVRFSLAPTPRPVAIELEVRDTQSGALVPRFTGYALQVPEAAGGDWGPSMSGMAATEEFEGREGRALCTLYGDVEGASLWVAAEGYVFAGRGLPADADADGRVSMTVELEPGWGAPLVASEERSGDPLPGVEVRADGRLLGVTDANGELALRAPERPQRLEFQLAGHSVADTTGPLFRSGRLKRRPGNPLSEVYGVSLQAD